MSFITKIPILPSSICPCSRTKSSNLNNNPPLKSSNFNLKPFNLKKLSIIKISNSRKNPISFRKMNSYPDYELENPHISSSGGGVSLRLKRLVSEFRSLPEPIDRVKRLLEYAAVLPQLGESTRMPENRVPGCAAQVWMGVEMDEKGRMMYKADSDSEITKGFCSCLIFLLDDAFPQDVLKVKAEDLADMNVGLPVRSRVNSWHNVLNTMQERTKSLLVDQDHELCQLEPLDTSLHVVIPANTSITTAKGFSNTPPQVGS